jgi:2,5-dihydroxypyridine 5,6-dioxygenase
MHSKVLAKRSDAASIAIGGFVSHGTYLQVPPGLLKAWSKVLSLSAVGPGAEVALLRGAIAYDANVCAARLAAAQLGARVMVLELDPYDDALGASGGALGGNRAVIEALKRVDIVLDMMGMDRGSEQFEILASGTRILLVKEPPETLSLLVPCADDKRRVLEATGRLKRARSMRVTSANGTDLSVQIGEYPCLTQYGYADEPGHWDHWPGAFVATWPNELTANGTVVLAPGDAILPFKQYVRTPVSLRVERGYVRAIEGGLDARYLRDYIAKFNDAEGYAVSHLGWGLYEPAHWTSLGMTDRRETNGMESRSFSGNFMFSTGPNAEAGGTRRTPCHLDIPMLDCTVELDGEPVVAAGKVVISGGSSAQ